MRRQLLSNMSPDLEPQEPLAEDPFEFIQDEPELADEPEPAAE